MNPSNEWFRAFYSCLATSRALPKWTRMHRAVVICRLTIERAREH